MKFHRTLAAAAAAVAIVPAVLLTATAAHADDDPVVTSASETATEQSNDNPSGTASESTEVATTPADDGTAATTTAPAEESAPATASDTPSGTPASSASPSASPSTGLPISCTPTDNPTTDNNLTTALSGLPSKVVAGSGWHGFTLEVDNQGGSSYKRVDLGVFAAAVDEDTYADSTGHLTLQWQDPHSGSWHDISLDEDDEGEGYVGYTDVSPHESLSLSLRLSVDNSAPAGMGFAISIGVYANDKGDCVYSGGDSFYQFDILAAGSPPGDVDDSEPQTGGKTPVTQPAGDTPIGNLADTGSSSALPAIALAGGAAVAVGVGAIFVVRRRKTDTGAAS